MGRVLGRGAYGKINLAIHKLTRRLCAVKSINKNLTQDRPTLGRWLNECFIHAQLRHDNVCTFFENISTLRHHLMFMELCRGGDLLHYVRRRRKLDENTAKVIFVQIVRGLQYIHSKNVMHRDIKLENILLDNLGQVKICDFGVSKVLEFPDSKVAECCGTPAYMAPEVVLTSQEFLDKKQKSNKRKRDPKPYGKECDIWSLGVVLYALLYGQLPFRGASAREIKDRVVKGDFFQKKTISDEANSLIKSILVADLNKRLSI